MKKQHILKTNHIILALFGSCLSLSAWAHQEQNNMIQCHIEAPTSVKAGEKVSLQFKLTNSSKHKLMVLKWNTPLEGWFGNSFDVSKDGKAVNYMGAMVKRFRPSEEDYASLSPGQSIEQTVNMAEGYDMKATGNYKLTFKGRLQDVQIIESASSLSSQRKLQTVSCNALSLSIQ